MHTEIKKQKIYDSKFIRLLHSCLCVKIAQNRYLTN